MLLTSLTHKWQSEAQVAYRTAMPCVGSDSARFEQISGKLNPANDIAPNP